MNNAMILLYVTCKDKAEARKIAGMLLKKRLIACANVFPIESIYQWKEKMVNEKEVVLLGKTTKSKADEAEKAIKRIHSYEYPCILKISVKVNEEFGKWVGESVRDYT